MLLPSDISMCYLKTSLYLKHKIDIITFSNPQRGNSGFKFKYGNFNLIQRKKVRQEEKKNINC